MERLKIDGGVKLEFAGAPRGPVVTIDGGDTLLFAMKGRDGAPLAPEVADGEVVRPGRVLARDASAHAIPLLAPRGGTVRLRRDEGLIALEGDDGSEAPPLPPLPDETKARVARVVDGGVWASIREARSGGLPDPAVAPEAVIVSTLSLEPFLVRGDRLLVGSVDAFERGLGALQSLLDYQAIHLVLPDVTSGLAVELREALRGKAWIRPHLVSLRYPLDHPALLARALGLHGSPRPVWFLDVATVLALDGLFDGGRPSLEKVVAVGGAVERPAFVRVPRGITTDAILRAVAPREGHGPLVAGGLFTGRRLSEGTALLDDEVTGLAVLAPARPERLLLFARPGAGLRSHFARAFLGGWWGGEAPLPRPEPGGETRACIACGACEEICPAGLVPQLLHRAHWARDWDGLERLRMDLCVGCGLCAWVCPSKLELRRDFLAAQAELASHRHGEGAR